MHVQTYLVHLEGVEEVEGYVSLGEDYHQSGCSVATCSLQDGTGSRGVCKSGGGLSSVWLQLA